MNQNLNFENTPKKTPNPFHDEEHITNSIQKAENNEQMLKHELKKMSYKAMADCLFDISTQIPNSQEVIQHYLPMVSIIDNQTSLKELTNNYQNSILKLTQTSKNLKENLISIDIYEDLALIDNFLQGSQDFDDIQENVKNDYLRDILRKIQAMIGNSKSKELKKQVLVLQSQNQRLQEKVSLSEKSL